MMMNEKLNELLERSEDKAFKISIALPTHRFTSENKQDLILYGNLLKEVRNKLEENYEKNSWETTFEKLEALKGDNKFWEHVSDGLLILASEDAMEIFSLDYPVNTHAIVSGNYHIQPLFIMNHQTENYYLADLKKDRVNLYELSGADIEEIKPENIKLNFDELFDDTDSNYNYNTTTFAGPGNTAHGHRSKSEEEDKYREKFYRYLDKEFKTLNSENGYRFILSGTTDNLAMFRQYTQEKFYLENDISKPLSPLSKLEILDEINKLLKPTEDMIVAGIKEDIDVAKGADKFTSDYKEVEKAADEGRIAKLIITEEIEDQSDDVDSLVNKAYGTKTDIVILKEDYDLGGKILAVLRY